MDGPAQVESVRRHNLSTVLRLLHQDGARLRSDLTALTGLNRSTIGALVNELVRLGLASSSPGDSGGTVGRPSPSVRVSDDPGVLAVNPEVDAVTIALVGLGGRIRERIRQPMVEAPSVAATAAVVAPLVEEFRNSPTAGNLLGIGVAVPGLVRGLEGVVQFAPHLGWTNEPVAQVFTEETGLPTLVANDASLGALAELRFGAGRGLSELVYLNGGASGIGGGIITSGQLLGGAAGFAGEFGHTRPGVPDRDLVTERGILEDEVGHSRLLESLGMRSATEGELRRAVSTATDPAICQELSRQQRVLGAAIAQAINVFSPSAILLGGALSILLDWDASRMREIVAADAMSAISDHVILRSAQLGEDRLLIGAAELAFGPVLDDPLLAENHQGRATVGHAAAAGTD